MIDKIVTFIVPAYNAEKHLDRCLSSFLLPEILEKIEIIVVNDGSKDRTADVAKKYTERYPSSFVLINKENGGHGSGINAAILQARGYYFRVIDSDDWVLTENLNEYVECLKSTAADVILTNYQRVDALGGKKTSFVSQDIAFGKVYSLEDVMNAGKGALICCMLYGLTYRTAFYRSCNVRLSEGISYEDQEYATIFFAQAHSILFLNLFLYQYLTGTTTQSMSDVNQVKRAPQLEQVFWKIATIYMQGKELSPSIQKFYLYKLSETLQSYYITMFIRNRDRATGRSEARRMRRKSTEAIPALKFLTNFRYWLLFTMHILHIKTWHLELLKKSPAYHWLRQIIR
ncbi:MAG: glycosyltransferase family 2 protein [Pyramidobacter sp.]|jgi:glycosyltransferase involved in cell wall biosynthesis